MQRQLLTAILLTVFTAVPARAQVLYGSLVGNVTDQSGASVAGAQVLVLNTNTNLTRTVDDRQRRCVQHPGAPGRVPTPCT
jgi:cell shape-determining protein MreD